MREGIGDCCGRDKEVKEGGWHWRMVKRVDGTRESFQVVDV